MSKKKHDDSFDVPRGSFDFMKDWDRAQGYSGEDYSWEDSKKSNPKNSSVKTTGTNTSNNYSYERCFHKHPVLEVLGGKLAGGSCTNPVHRDADIYIGLDYSMKDMAGKFPWRKSAQEVQDFHVPIQDMRVPADAEDFKLMVDWLVEQLKAGKFVHVGCMGGHGRTGTLLSAIICKGLGLADSTSWVREHYCKKAVESKEQVEWLKKHFGITPVEPTKEGYTSYSGQSAYKGGTDYNGPGSGKKQAGSSGASSGTSRTAGPRDPDWQGSGHLQKSWGWNNPGTGGRPADFTGTGKSANTPHKGANGTGTDSRGLIHATPLSGLSIFDAKQG